jgi:hypothetical protein
MKKNIIFTILLTVLIGVSYSQAQSGGGKNKGQHKGEKSKEHKGEHEHGRENMSPEDRAKRSSDRLEKKLSLSAEQKTKVYDFALIRVQKAGALKADTTKDKKAKGADMKTIRDEFVSNVNTILTPEQKTKWEQMRAEAKARRQEKRKEGGNTKSPAVEEAEDDLESED